MVLHGQSVVMLFFFSSVEVHSCETTKLLPDSFAE